MTAKDIVRLTMHKNSEGKWHCPVTFKVCLLSLSVCYACLWTIGWSRR